MAQANIGSRRACEELIIQGRVRVNGQVAALGAKADPALDTIEVDGQKLAPEAQRKIYIALNKPKNVLSTTMAQKGDERQTVRELVPVQGHLFTIGRLDADSDGLIVLTNDGELVQKLTHPRYRHTKTYKVVVYGLPNAATLAKWENGVWLEEDGMTAPCSVKVMKADKGFATLRITMTEGKKRQIRRTALLLGHPVRHLTRTHIGRLQLGTLRPGEWRELNESDLQLLKTSEPLARREPVRRVRSAHGPNSGRPARKPQSKTRRRSP